MYPDRQGSKNCIFLQFFFPSKEECSFQKLFYLPCLTIEENQFKQRHGF
jgi:hypothetical protein